MENYELYILQQLRKGDQSALEYLFDKYYIRLCLFARRFVNFTDVAEEIVSETFFHLWEYKTSVIISTSVKSYLFRAVQNNCLNHIKHEQVKRKYEKKTTQEYQQMQLIYNEFQPKILENDLEAEIEKAVSLLPEQCQKVFRLSRFEGLKYKEIAEKLELSVKTVERHMGIAFEKLREHLKDFLVLFLIFLK